MEIEPIDLEAEVYSERIADLVRKLEETIVEAGYSAEEVLPALSEFLVFRFAEAEDPDRVYRIFTVMLGRQFDELMDEVEEDEDGMEG